MNENRVVWIGSFGPAKAVVFSRILGENDGLGEDDDVDIPLQVKPVPDNHFMPVIDPQGIKGTHYIQRENIVTLAVAHRDCCERGH